MIPTTAQERMMFVVVKQVSEGYGIAPDDILGRSKHAEIVHARQEAMLHLRTLGYAYDTIGWYFDRDHSTVMHDVRTAQRRESA